MPPPTAQGQRPPSKIEPVQVWWRDLEAIQVQHATTAQLHFMLAIFPWWAGFQIWLKLLLIPGYRCISVTIDDSQCSLLGFGCRGCFATGQSAGTCILAMSMKIVGLHQASTKTCSISQLPTNAPLNHDSSAVPKLTKEFCRVRRQENPSLWRECSKFLPFMKEMSWNTPTPWWNLHPFIPLTCSDPTLQSGGMAYCKQSCGLPLLVTSLRVTIVSHILIVVVVVLLAVDICLSGEGSCLLYAAHLVLEGPPSLTAEAACIVPSVQKSVPQNPPKFTGAGVNRKPCLNQPFSGFPTFRCSNHPLPWDACRFSMGFQRVFAAGFWIWLPCLQEVQRERFFLKDNCPLGGGHVQPCPGTKHSGPSSQVELGTSIKKSNFDVVVQKNR